MGTTKKADYRQLDLLVAKAMEGNKKAFEELCKKEAPLVIYACMKLLKNQEDAEDAAQEVFVRVQRYLSTLSAPEAYVVWVQKIIRDVCSKTRRGAMNQNTFIPVDECYDELVEADRCVIPKEYISDKELRRELIAIIDALPDKKRDCIMLHYFNGLKISEIADVLAITEGTVKAHLYGARNKIKQEIELREEKIYTNAPACLPMVALSNLFAMDLSETVTPAMAYHCLKGAGVSSFSLLGGVSLAGAKGAAIAALSVVTIVFTATAYYSAASEQGSASQPSKNASSYHPSDSGEKQNKNEAITQENISPTPLSDEESSEKPEGEGVSVPPVVPPISEAEPLNDAVPTYLQGRLVVQGTISEGYSLEGQFYVILEQKGVQLALTNVKSDGSFFFEGVSLTEEGTYTLRAQALHNYGLAPSPEQVSIHLKPGQTFFLEQPLVLLEQNSPAVAVSLWAHGKNTALNPETIEIEIYHPLLLELTWKIFSESGVVIEMGTEKKIGGETLNNLSSGAYILQVCVSDGQAGRVLLERAFYKEQ